MSCEDVIELSSDAEKPSRYDDKLDNFSYDLGNGQYGSDRSSFDEHFLSDSDDEGCRKAEEKKLDIEKVDKNKLHDISSSDEDNISYLQKKDHDSGYQYNGPLETHSSQPDNGSAETQSSQPDNGSAETQNSQPYCYPSSQDINPSKEARVAERERKRIEKLSSQVAKQKERDERKKQKEILMKFKNEQKQQKKQAAYKRNQIKPNECLKYMTVVVDEKLFKTVLCSKAMELFPYQQVKFTYKQQMIENSITWQRSQLNGSLDDEDWITIMWTAEELVHAIQESTLTSSFKNITKNVYPNKTVVLFIFSLELYHRKSQNARSYKARKEAQRSEERMTTQHPGSEKYLTREEIELGLVELQILAGVSHRKFENTEEFTDILAQFTKAIAQIPYKREKEEVDKEMGWYAKVSYKNCIRINKDMQGLDRLWIQHLSVYNGTNVDQAKAIATLYPTPTALIEAYENCSSQTKKELLLQNIQIVRSGSTSAVTRRIGPELSKKICWTFTQTDGDAKLTSKK